MIYGSILQTNSVGKETTVTFKDHFRRLIWFGHHDLSDTTKSSNKSISPLESEFKVENLQTTKLESIKALNLKADHNTPSIPKLIMTQFQQVVELITIVKFLLEASRAGLEAL